MYACTQQFVDRSTASVQLCDSVVNLDSCVEDGFFLFFGVWIRHIGPIFPFPNSQSTWQVRLRCLIAADTDRRSYSPLPPGTMSSILFTKHVSFEHSVSSPRPAITSRREEKNNKAKVFQHPIDSHSQSASSCPISPHFAAGAVGVGRVAASFLATESTGTVLIPRLMTRIAFHVKKVYSPIDKNFKGFYWPKAWRKRCAKSLNPIFRFATPSTGQKWKEVVLGTRVYQRPLLLLSALLIV